MNLETLPATNLLRHLHGRSFCNVAEELAHAEGAYDPQAANARIDKAIDKGFLTLDDDFYRMTPLGDLYVTNYDEEIAAMADQQRVG